MLSIDEANRLKALITGSRPPEAGLEKHFMRVLRGEAMPCTAKELEWYEFWRLNQSTPPETHKPSSDVLNAMPARKVLSNGWMFLLARHSQVGLILLDKAHQDGCAAGLLKAFVLARLGTSQFEREEFKKHLSSSVSDNEFVNLVTAYNEFKRKQGFPLKASPDVAHVNFLLKRGLPYYGVRPREDVKVHRVTMCWNCKEELDNNVDIECNNCGWIICTCGACGCGRKTKKH